MIAVGSIEYSGYKETLVYEKIKCGEVEYTSGDFIKDWYDLMLDIYKHQRYDHIVFSSSLNDFFFDGADYDSAYLAEIKPDVWEFIYGIDDGNIEYLISNSIEFFVPNGTKMTWEEYKQAYKNNL